MTERQKLELKDVVRNVLEEARMVLPGIQALFGFQLVAVFNASFKDIPAADHIIHLVALMLTICSVACLMAPASYHRQVELDEVSSEFVNYASKLICIGMLPLLLSISLDTYVVTNAITHATMLAATTAGVACLLLSTLWYAVPLLHRLARKQDCSNDTNRKMEGQHTAETTPPSKASNKHKAA